MEENKFDYKKYFKGKKLTKQGFGVLGRGFGVVKFLLECGAIMTVTDLKPESDFTEQIAELESLGFSEKNGKVKYVFGKHRDEDFTNCDFVIQASGVLKDNKYLILAKENGVQVYQESSLFVKIVNENFKNIKIVGVTGTRGKTTTTFLIYEMLCEKLGKEIVHLGGNVQGVATLEILKNIKEGDVVIMELDSWILQGFGDVRISPNISVFTSFMPDHMNYYKGDMKDYFLDKANIFMYQKEGDLFVTTNIMQDEIEKYLGERVEPGLKDLIDVQNLMQFESHLLGLHNQVTINLVYRVAKYFKISEDNFRSFVKTFKGVKGRLEYVKEIGGVRIYNDTCATTGDATVAGLSGIENILSEGKKIILICGGRNKELDMQNLISKFTEMQKEKKLEIIMLTDETTTGTEKFIESIKDKNSTQRIIYTEVKNLSEGIKLALRLSYSGDIILFSPAFASFGMFKNEYDRGEKFMEIVDGL